MSRPLLTASGLWRHALCIGSAVLPRAGHVNPWADHGSGLHAFLLDMNRVGRSAALARVKAEKTRAACALLNVDRLPVDAALYAAEVAYAFNVRTERARELGRDLKRSYVDAGADPDEDVCGTADVVALVDDDTVYVADYKSGHRIYAAPEVTWQFRALALLAARAYNRDHAIVELVRLGSDGEPYVTRGELDVFELAAIADEIRALFLSVTIASTLAEPPCTTGSHCGGCDSISFCRAATGLLMAARHPEEHLAVIETEITADRAERALELAEAVVALGETMLEQVKRYATTHPIKTADGLVYGPVDEAKSSPEGVGVFHFLEGIVGTEEAWRRCKLSSTWSALEELAAAEAAKNGGKRAHIMKAWREELEHRGAVKWRHYTTVKRHKPRRIE